MSTTWKMPQTPPPLPSPVASRRRQRSAVGTTDVHRGWRQYQSTGWSLLFHCLLFVVLALLTTGSRGQASLGPAQSVVMAMVAAADSNQGFYVEDVGASLVGTSEASSAGGGSSTLVATATGDGAPVDTARLLAGIDPGDAGSGIGDVGTASGGLGLGDGGPKLGGSALVPSVKTSVFGLEGVGSRFIYVFDRSSSMNGYGGLPMAHAKSELIKSLASLGKAHQFQLIFYNETPLAYGQLSGMMQLMQGTDENKQQATGYVRRMQPDGGTEHLPALRLALSMGPDVIFFLTDADQPALNRRNLEDCADRAQRLGAVIHTIQFGAGGNQGSGAWIAELARLTGGKYRYMDVTTFKADAQQ